MSEGSVELAWLGAAATPIGADWHPDAISALTPFFASPEAFWSTIGIFAGTLAIAGWLMLLDQRKARRERQVIAFVRRRVRSAPLDTDVLYRPNEPDFAKSGLLGDNDLQVGAWMLTSTGRILAMLHNDARFYRYEPVHLAMRAEEQGIRLYSHRIGAVQTLAIRAGILGTFIGLISSLAQVQGVFLLRGAQIGNDSPASLAREFAGIKDQIGELMGDVVQGLALAFGTSIAGILAAILIALLASVSRSRADRLIVDIQKTCVSAQTFFRDYAANSEELVRTADELRAVMKDNLRQLADARSDIHRHVDNLAGVSGKLADGLSDPVRLFAENAAQIKSMLEQGRDTAQHIQVIDARMRSIEATSTERLERLTAQIDAATRSSTEALQTSLERSRITAATALETIAASLSSGLTETSTAIASGLGDRVEEGLRRGISEGFAIHLQTRQPAIMEMLDRLQADTRKQSRRSFSIYVSAVLALCLASIASVFWLGVGRVEASRPVASVPSVATEADNDR